jgi:hypothetical protein
VADFRLAQKFISGTDIPSGNASKTLERDRNFVMQYIMSLTGGLMVQ